MNNPLTKPPLNQGIMTLAELRMQLLGPTKQEAAKLRDLKNQLASAIKHLAFVEAQLTKAWKEALAK